MSNSEIESCLIEGSKKCNEGISTAFVAYEICTKTKDSCGDGTKEIKVERRYSQFFWLEKQLIQEYPSCILPPLPGKSLETKFEVPSFDSLDKFNKSFVDRRKITLQRFLDIVIAHRLMKNSKSLHLFLSQESLPLQLYRHNEGILESLNDRISRLFLKKKSFSDERLFSKYKQIENYEHWIIEFLSAFESAQHHLKKYSKKAFAVSLLLTEDASSLPENMCIPLSSFGSNLKLFTKETDDVVFAVEQDLILALKDSINFARNALFSIQSFELRQEEHEKLKKITQEIKNAKERMKQNPYSDSSSTLKTIYYRAMDTIKGTQYDDKHQKNLLRLEIKLEELSNTLQKEQFERDADMEILLQDIEFFFEFSNNLINSKLQEHSQCQANLHEKCFDMWKPVI